MRYKTLIIGLVATTVLAMGNPAGAEDARVGVLMPTSGGAAKSGQETLEAVKLAVDPETGEVDVQKMWLAFDCGTVVDPDGARAQCEGAALWGLSLALHEGTRIENGNVIDLNLGAYTPLRLADVPELEIDFVESIEVPVGLGEPGTTVIAPAIANAIFNATGARVRHLPITGDAVLAAMKS